MVSALFGSIVKRMGLRPARSPPLLCMYQVIRRLFIMNPGWLSFGVQSLCLAVSAGSSFTLGFSSYRFVICLPELRFGAILENYRREKRARYADGSHAISVLRIDSSQDRFSRTDKILRDGSYASPVEQRCSTRFAYGRL